MSQIDASKKCKYSIVSKLDESVFVNSERVQ